MMHSYLITKILQFMCIKTLKRWSKLTKREFPKTFKHENGNTLVARDETQASALEKQGFKEVKSTKK